MKTYFFRDLMWAAGFFFIWASIFIYGMIWLNNGFDADKRLYVAKNEIIQEIIRSEAMNRAEITYQMNRIMPSALRNRK